MSNNVRNEICSADKFIVLTSLPERYSSREKNKENILFLLLFQCGSILHAQLEIWKAAVEESPRNTLAASWGSAVVQTPNNNNNASSTIANAAPASVTGSTCSVDFSDGKSICSYDFN